MTPLQHLEGVQISIQLAVISGLDVSPVVLVEVGQAVVHKDITLRHRGVHRRLTTTHYVHTGPDCGTAVVRVGYLEGLLQVEGQAAGARPRAVPAEAVGAVEAGAGHVCPRVVDLSINHRQQVSSSQHELSINHRQQVSSSQHEPSINHHQQVSSAQHELSINHRQQLSSELELSIKRIVYTQTLELLDVVGLYTVLYSI